MKRILLVGMLFFAIWVVKGQGCSDAGACSVGTMDFLKSVETDRVKMETFIEQTFGLGEKFVIIGQTTAAIKYQLFKKTQLQLRAPFIFTVGNLGVTSGVGDMIFSVTQALFSGDYRGVSFLVGTRIKSNNSDFEFDGNPLPMAYQTSLGSYDILSGIFYYWKKNGFLCSLSTSF